MTTVTVYSKPACPQCTMTYRALDAKSIQYRVVDVTEVEAAMLYVVEELGYRAAPVVVVDDEPENHWSGFRPDLIDRLPATAA
ncbi:redoxin NrdH [Agrococcus versicolor]|uniref:Glutaredoxin-like protein NrdH n=1 Tax=Agrococcus versicolor TaxID=501482 RepID=A0ABP5MJQ2_9MICO